MGHLGIEPRANQLKAEYSTIELVTLISPNYNSYNELYAKILECIK